MNVLFILTVRRLKGGRLIVKNVILFKNKLIYWSLKKPDKKEILYTDFFSDIFWLMVY